jgi:hypothetical protein
MSVFLENKVRATVSAARQYPQFRRPERALAICAVAAAVLIMADANGPIFAVSKLAVWLIVPGWVLLRRLPLADPAARVAWTVLASVVVATVLGLIMAWTGLWHPRPVATVVLISSAAVIFFTRGKEGPGPDSAPSRMDQVGRGTFSLWIPWLVLGFALVMWWAALLATDTGQLGDLGLLAAYPASWFGALGLVLAVCIWGVVGRHAGSKWIMSASVTSLVLILYSSASLLTTVPRLPWAYKHIAVTDYISASGHLDPSIDIYNRWPGFFTASAFVGEFIGYRDAAEYASWAEIGFALVDVLLVLAIARTISGNPRVYWTATLVFALTNWVGQNYYAPQAFAFTMYLTMCLTALTFLRGTPVKVARLMERWSVRPLPTEDRSGSAPGGAPQIAAIVAILVLQGVVAASHQLTPYMAVLGLLPLFAFGFFRPKWVGPVLLAIAIGYLLPNLEYVSSSYGLFSGFDVLANAGARLSAAGPVPDAAKWQEIGVRALSGLTVILALLGFLRHFRNGEVRTTLMVGWLAIAPALTLFGQSYGGEGRLRVYLFALPWLAMGVAWLFWSGGSRTRSTVFGAAVSLMAMALLFTATYFQPESRYRVPEGDVIAAKWLDSRVEWNDLTVLSAGAFPVLIGPNYPIYLQPEKLKSLEGLLGYFQDAISAGDVEYYIRTAGTAGSAGKTYVVFSKSQEQYVAEMGIVEATVLLEIEAQLVKDGTTEKVFDNGYARIYQFTSTAR